MINWTMVLMCVFAAAISISFAVVMIYGGGKANINTYGEGWFEVLFAGGLAAAGWKRVRA